MVLSIVFAGEIPAIEEHLQSLFRVVHTGPIATAIQSLVLLYQVMESRQTVSSRYYQALYTKLLDPELRHSGKQASANTLLLCTMLYACIQEEGTTPAPPNCLPMDPPSCVTLVLELHTPTFAVSCDL